MSRSRRIAVAETRNSSAARVAGGVVRGLLVAAALASAACTPSRQPAPERSVQAPKKSHDGRAGSVCPGWPRHPDIPLCSPSLLRLVARGEDYDGQLLELTGQVMRADGVAYLCPAAQLCGEGDWSNAVQLPASTQLDALVPAAGAQPGRVTVIGKYSATTRGRHGQVAGVLLSLEVAFRTPGPP